MTDEQYKQLLKKRCNDLLLALVGSEDFTNVAGVPIIMAVCRNELIFAEQITNCATCTHYMLLCLSIRPIIHVFTNSATI